VIDAPGASVPIEFALSQNYPNPFNGETNFELRVPASQAGIAKFSAKGGCASGAELISLKVFDILGREVAILVNEAMSPGSYRIRWNSTGLSSGVYFCRLRSGDASTGSTGSPQASSARGLVQTRKALLLK
jgi:hypothetical protein